MDGCVDHILSINRSDIQVRNGNFSSYFENFERDQASEALRNEQLKKEAARLKEASQRSASWADKTERSKYGKASSGLSQDKGFVGHKAAKMMKSAKVTELHRQKALEEKKELLRNAETSERLKLSPLVPRAERMASFADAALYYGEKQICSPVSFSIGRGDRIALEGKNGCGKSSLLKLLIGEEIKHTGTVILSSGLVVSYVPQHSDHLHGSVQDFARENNLDEVLFRAVLDKMGFEKAYLQGDISSFSEGQKRKLLLSKSLCERAHLYVWDEPLNYIDVYSRMQIENLLKEFQPTMIFVEHDEAFRRAVATKQVMMG